MKLPPHPGNGERTINDESTSYERSATDETLIVEYLSMAQGIPCQLKARGRTERPGKLRRHTANVYSTLLLLLSLIASGGVAQSKPAKLAEHKEVPRHLPIFVPIPEQLSHENFCFLMLPLEMSAEHQGEFRLAWSEADSAERSRATAFLAPTAGLKRLPPLGTECPRLKKVDLVSKLSAPGKSSWLGAVNRVVSLEPLRGLDELEVLHLGGNLVTDLSVLLDLPSLKYVSLYGNPLSGRDTADQIAALQEAGVVVSDRNYGFWDWAWDAEPIIDVCDVGDLTTPGQDCPGKVVPNFESLFRHAMIDDPALRIWTSMAVSIPGNSESGSIEDIRYCWADRVGIYSLRGIKGLVQLRYLYLGNSYEIHPGTYPYTQTSRKPNRIFTLRELEGLESLEILDVHGNEIRDLEPLLGQMCLRYVDLRDNPLSEKALQVQIPQLQARGVRVIM